MDKLRNHQIELIPEMVSTLIDGLDVMKELLDLEVSEELTRETFTEMTSDLLSDIRAYINGETPASAQTTQEETPVVETETPPSTNEHLLDENIGFYDEDVNESKFNVSYGFFKDDEIGKDNENYGFFDDELDRISETAITPTIEHEEGDDFGFFDDMPDISPDAEITANNKDQKEEIMKKEVSKAAPKTDNPKPSTPPAAAAKPAAPKRGDREVKEKKASASNNIRVNLDKIDLLMNNVGDLVITNAMLTQFSTSIEEAKTRNAVLERLELLERHIRDMQDSIMSIRMVPMESIYSKFPKVVEYL